MKKAISLMMVVLMLSICLISCGSKNDDLIGTWSYSESSEELGMDLEMSFTFEKDGKASISTMGISVSATYEVDGDKLTITPESSELFGDSEDAVMKSTYSVSGDTLKLVDSDSGETIELKKK